MKITLTASEMLDEWKLRRAIEPFRADCTAMRSDAIDIDGILMRMIRDWYHKLLLTAPLSMLATSDISSRLQWRKAETSLACASLPDDCVRVVSVHWDDCAVDALTDIGRFRRHSRNPYVLSPMAAVSSDGILWVSPADGSDVPTVTAVVEPDYDTYIMDESALQLIPVDENILVL